MSNNCGSLTITGASCLLKTTNSAHIEITVSQLVPGSVVYAALVDSSNNEIQTFYPIVELISTTQIAIVPITNNTDSIKIKIIYNANI